MQKVCLCICVCERFVIERERSDSVDEKMPTRIYCILHIYASFFFSFSLISECRLALPRFPKRCRVISKRLPPSCRLINKVNLFPPFIFMNPQSYRTRVSAVPQYISPPNWQKLSSFIRSTQPAYYKSPLICHISFQ